MATNPPAKDRPLIRGFDHSVTLPVFEGPLDLLLFLIRKSEIDIYDIPIERITRQYLDILRSMETQQLEVAGEFFVMAATLMHIKSRMLLPKDEQLPGMADDEEEDVDPRWELVQQLIEYRKFKDAAGSLSELMDEAQNILFREYFTKAEERVERPLHPSDPISLWNTFNQVLRRLSEKIVIGQIHDETVTVSERMEDIIAVLKERPRFNFSHLINGPVSVHFVVSTFLALLELCRLDRILLHQDESFGDITCTAKSE
ncbi:MAG: segregation and condensation protein A [Opitutales bacterium]|jgi:segregation and condensation protein A